MGAQNKSQYFAEYGTKIHGNKYNYSKIDKSKTKKEKNIIICPMHGRSAGYNLIVKWESDITGADEIYKNYIKNIK